jgi:hypothetical protein
MAAQLAASQEGLSSVSKYVVIQRFVTSVIPEVPLDKQGLKTSFFFLTPIGLVSI